MSPDPDESAFWDGESRLALGLPEIVPIDVADARATKSCLGTADQYFWVALSLILADHPEKAWPYVLAIRELAMTAYDTKEQWTYASADSSNHFGGYAAMRLAALSDWLLRGDRRLVFLDRGLSRLEAEMDAVSRSTSSAGAYQEATIAGHRALHLAQLGRWTELQAMPVPTSGRNVQDRLWRRLYELLARMPIPVPMQGSAPTSRSPGEAAFDTWFRSLVDHKKHGRAYHPALTPADIVDIAEVRARWLFGVTDPIETVRSIRSPDGFHDQR